MITASHNPKEDNGYKVFWSNGPQIKPPHDKLILQSIGRHLKPENDQAFNENVEEFQNLIIDPTDELGNLYYEKLFNSSFDIDNLNCNLSHKIIYSAMHGVGAAYIDKAFDTVHFKPVIHVSEQRMPDPVSKALRNEQYLIVQCSKPRLTYLIQWTHNVSFFYLGFSYGPISKSRRRQI